MVSLRLCSIVLLLMPRLALGSSWIHEVSGTINPSPDFSLETVAQENGRLIGRGTYRETAENLRMQLEGIQTNDGRFWPNVVTEIGNDLNGEWRKVNTKLEGLETTLKFDFDKPTAMLHFDLDCLRSYIGKVLYGKITLPNGRIALFTLNELLPPNTIEATKSEQAWMLTTLVGYREDPIVTAPFFISGVAFENGHLRVIGSYSNPSDAPTVVIKGSKSRPADSEEDKFWASAVLEVSNNPEGAWRTIGEAAGFGQPASITITPGQQPITELDVCVDQLRSLIAEYGYGRAVLKNGKSAMFRMKNLLPPDRRR
jgi:hypothetical protein